MTRKILEEARIHSAIRDVVATHQLDIVQEVEAALSAHKVVVVGMAQNPMPKRARKALDAAGIAHHYLEYGSYFSEWKQRLAIKQWSGWPTFPQVFVRGVLIGGEELTKVAIADGTLVERAERAEHAVATSGSPVTA